MNERRIHASNSNSRKGGQSDGKPHGLAARPRGHAATALSTINTTPAAAIEEENKRKRENRKQSKRALQLAAMEKKADEEDKYFRECQREAFLSKKNKKPKPNNPAAERERENQLFGSGGLSAGQGINFEKYSDIRVEVRRGGSGKSSETTEFSNFDDLDLHPTIRRNVQLLKYVTPTPIQRSCIPLAMEGDDLMCCAQTGSGKTCAFLLPICASFAKQPQQPQKPPSPSEKEYVHGVELRPEMPRCVVLAPTRELATQIEMEAQKLCHQFPSIKTVAVYGGVNQRKQIRDLAFGCEIIVATPGRLTDFVDRSIISLAKVQFLVLDEADRLCDMGFQPQLQKIILRSNMTPKDQRQTVMFSATFPDNIQKLAGEFLRQDYTWIAAGRVGSTTDNITQVILRTTKAGDKQEKLQLVVEAIQKGPLGRTLVFVQKKRTASWLKKQLVRGGSEGGYRFQAIAADEIHGDRSQPQREAALAAFRSGDCRVLVATDVAARGLDISGVQHVINMDLPTAADEFDSYVHRIGRTGRAGHTGLATALYTPGLQPKVGNGKIAKLMVQQLRETKQEVPSWLEAECQDGPRRSSGGDGVATAASAVGNRDMRVPSAGRGGPSSRPSGGGRCGGGAGSGRGGRGRGNGGASRGGGRGRSAARVAGGRSGEQR